MPAIAVIIPAIISLVTTGAGIFSQIKQNQATKKEADKLIAVTKEQNALAKAQQDAQYALEVEKQIAEKQALKQAQIEQQTRQNQIITTSLIVLFLGLLVVVVINLKK
jgi:Flp pilus assembly protein TadB